MSWIMGDRYLSEAEMKNNAQEFINWARINIKGVTKEAVSALLGNLVQESTINPQLGERGGSGYGLFQWTPKSKLVNWCNSNGYHWNRPSGQLARFVYEANNGLQWFSNPTANPVNPPYSLKDFLSASDEVATMTRYFMWYYEHPSYDPEINMIAKRIRYAEYYFSDEGGLDWTGIAG